MTEDNANKDQEEIRVVEEYVEGYWVCPNCSAKCRGSEQGCSNCGAIRGENVEFFCDDDAPAITDAEELEKAKSGPDWICQFCGNTSPANTSKCTGCGSDREDGSKRKVKDVPLEPSGKKTLDEPPKPLPMGCKIGCGIFAVIFLILMALSCQEKAGRLEVTEASWKRSIQLEQLQRVRETAWRNEVPAGATRVSSSREIRSYNQIPDGFEEVDETYTERVKVGEKKVKDGKVDLGNGRFKIKYKMVPQYEERKKTRRVRRQKYRKEPVYDEKVTYDINRWRKIDTAVKTGVNTEPVWPETKVVKRSPPQVGDIREGARSEEFTIKAKRLDSDDVLEFKKILDKPVTYEQFMKLRKGTQWEAVFSGLGTLNKIKLEPDKPEQ
jgi:hypothetical protein